MRKLILAAACCALAGCIFKPNLRDVRVCAYDIGWTGYDILGVTGGEAYTLEITGGTDTEPDMGPLYFGFMATVHRFREPGGEALWEYRGGIRALSSMLDGPSWSYPYAVVGSYFGFYQPAGTEAGRLGVGVEGGFGARLGLSNRAAADIDFLMSYGHFEGSNNLLSTRFGGAITMKW
jgi:hypothetical protein